VSVLSDVLDLLEQQQPTLGTGQLLSVDGPAGSGKSTLARAVAGAFDDRQRAARREGTATVLHMDDLFEGWSGLATVDAQLDSVLRPLAAGRAGHYRRYDWLEDSWAETVLVPPCPLLVVEGVGSGAARFDHLRSLLVWIEAPHDERLRRGVERDGEAFAPHWEQWAADEEELFARERTRERADLHVDGTASLVDQDR
jgi:uridine kinase